MRVAFHGYVHDTSGYGTAARGHVAALRLAGCDVIVNPRRGLVERQHAIRILHAVPDQLEAMASSAEPARRTIVMSVWETTRLPRSWLEPLRRHADEIWTPSEHSAVAFREVGVPVFVMPHPVEMQRSIGVGREEGPFMFLHVGEWSERKNQLGLTEAFAKAFGAERDDVRLYLVSHDAPELVESHGAKHALVDRNRPNAYRLATLYGMANAYVSLHRAEGFGLCIAEAMAHGLPVICTHGSAPAQWADFDGGGHYTPVDRGEVPCPDTYPFDSSMTWSEPDIDDAAEAMRELVQMGPRRSAAHWAREHVRTHLDPLRIGQMMRERLEAT